MNYDTMLNEKINTKLEFPELLDLKEEKGVRRKKTEGGKGRGLIIIIKIGGRIR